MIHDTKKFSVLSPVFQYFKLFGSALPSGMVTVKLAKLYGFTLTKLIMNRDSRLLNQLK